MGYSYKKGNAWWQDIKVKSKVQLNLVHFQCLIIVLWPINEIKQDLSQNLVELVNDQRDLKSLKT